MANQGGTHEQHVKAGQQSHKGSDEKLHGAAAKSHADKQSDKSSGSGAAGRDSQSKGGQQGKNNH